MGSNCKDMAKRRIMNILLLLIHSTIGQKPSAPTNVVMDLEFINGAPKITGRWNAPLSTNNMATIEHYLLVVAVNGTSSSNTTVPASTNSVNIFEALPNISQKKYTTYSLRVASVSNTGQSYLTNPVSVVSNLLQSASVTAGVRKIEVFCSVADSKPKTLCIAVISNRTARDVYTFQVGDNLIMLNYAPGEYNVTISVLVMMDGNLVAMQETTFQSVFVPTMVPTSSSLSLSSLSLSSLPLMMSSSTVVLPSFSSRPASTSTLTSKMTSSVLPMLPTPFTVSVGNSNHGGDGGSEDSSEGSLAAVLATILVCTLMLSVTIMLTVIVLIWWRQNQRKNSNHGAVATAIKASEKSCIKPSVNVEVDDSPLYEELDTIKDKRYSGAVASTKSRINSAIMSNHSSYIEMHPSVSTNELAGRNVIMQPNPSYHAVANTNS